MTTEAPAPLLSPDQQAQLIRRACLSPRIDSPDINAIAAAFEAQAAFATFRLQVAEQLRLLLTEEDVMPMLPPADRTKCFLRNIQVRNAAKALHTDL